MSLSIKFNGVELSDYIQATQDFTPFVGVQWEPVVNTDNGIVCGADYQYTTYKSKTIEIPFKMRYGLEGKYDGLEKALNVREPKPLIFGNIPGKVFYAVPSGALDFSEVAYLGTGTLTFIVPDGLAHSVAEKSFKATEKNGVLETKIINNGTESVPVDYTIKHNHENGYIGVVSEHGVIQLGYVSELDKEQRSKSVTLFDYRKPGDYDAMTTGQAILGYNYDLNGTFGHVSANGHQWLGLASVGSGTNWHGAGKLVTLPMEAEGNTDFYIQGKVWFETGKTDQTGLLQMAVGDENGAQLASIRIAKYDLNNNVAWAIFDIKGVEKHRISFSPSWDNVTASDKGHIYIDKKGDLFNFYFGGTAHPFREPSLAGAKAKTVSIFLGQHGTANQLITRMYFDYLFFRRDNVHYYYDVPNRYGKGSEVYIDGATRKVYVDGILKTEDEIIGSDYFHVPPGETKVQFMYSDFSNPPPTITAKIREAYL